MHRLGLREATAQIADIHQHLLKSEVFRGYRAPTMLLTSLAALAATALQLSVFPTATPARFCVLWLVVAGCCALACACDIVATRSLLSHGRWRRTLTVVAQSLPALVGGALIAIVVLLRFPELAGLLPAVWCFLFALSVFSARPYLPRAIGWVGAFYFAAGTLELLILVPDSVPSPWSMGLPFGLGQAALALVFHLDIRREQAHG